MKTTERTLIEQLKISRYEIEKRKEYLDLTKKDIDALVSLREVVADNIDQIVEKFYQNIVRFDEMDRVIGDIETLNRLKNSLIHYVLSLFEGEYEEDYVLSRLRVGVVHKRIGVEPKYYVSSVHSLSSILKETITSNDLTKDCGKCVTGIIAIEKILMFDLSLTFDMYINSLMDEVKRSKKDLQDYALSLEEIINERTKLLKEQARHDGLTGLLNQRSFYKELRKELLRGQRRNYDTVLLYFDLDGFKKVNDIKGHKRGDEILVLVAKALKDTLRETETSARYGGDEFCVILPDSSLKDGKILAERLCSEIEKAVKGSGVTCSIGVAASNSEINQDADSLVKAADKAMYEAKKVNGFSIKTAE